MKKIFLLTTFVVLFFVPFMARANVIINEITWMGTTTDHNDEWIELYNDSDQPIDLPGWILEAADGTPKINLTGTISAKGYFLLERTNDDTVPGIAADQVYAGALGNNGEYLKLKNNSGTAVDEVNCSGEWIAGNNDTKQTMERTISGWQTSLDPGGTPKAQNSNGATEEPEQTVEKPETPTIPTGNQPPIADAGDNIIAFINQEIKFDGTKSSDPDNDELHYEWNMGDGKLIEEPSFTYKYLYPGTYLVTLMVYDGKNYVSDTITVKIKSQEITINEFLPNPSGKDEEEEWIEIYNDSDSVVDISGWQLDDEASGSAGFTFPQNTLIAPKSYIVFSRQITGIALNNDKDTVRLLLPEGLVFQEIDYENPPMGESSARTDEGFVWSVPTPGMANIVSIPEAIGGNNEEIIYQYEPQKEIVKEYSKKYAIEYSPPEQKVEGGFIESPSYTKTTEDEQEPLEESELTAVVNKESLSENKIFDKNSFILILTLAGVIIIALIIGLIITKFLKKSS